MGNFLAKTVFAAAAVALAAGEGFADEKPYVRKGAPRFGEIYLNLRLFVKPANRDNFSSLEPDGAGFWRYHADEAAPATLGVDGRNGDDDDWRADGDLFGGVFGGWN